MFVTARLNGKWLSAPKHRAKMADATQKVQAVVLGGSMIFLGRHGNLRRPTMEIRGRILPTIATSPSPMAGWSSFRAHGRNQTTSDERALTVYVRALRLSMN